MRCRLCGTQLERPPRSVWCIVCGSTLSRWAGWAAEQHLKTGRMPSVTVTFANGVATATVDSSGGQPSPNDFVGTPPKQLSSVDAVHIAIPQKRSEASSGIGPGSSNAEIAFYLRLKATPGCVSKMNHTTDVMHLYIQPHSAAARLFVQRMMANLRGLPPGKDQIEQIRRLGLSVQHRLGDGGWESGLQR